MHDYGVRDVERLVHLTRSTIRAFVEAGFVSPARGPRNTWRFSFQDLIVLRTAQALAAANVPHKRITQSVKKLRRHLPDSMPLSGLTLCAEDDQVVVKEGARRWQAESGQYLLAFEGDPAEGAMKIIDRPDGAQEHGAQAWYDQGLAVEDRDSRSAIQAYLRAIEADPSFLKAHLNLGYLLHESRRHADAERVYRQAIAACGPDPLLLYNLGVLLTDMGRKSEAMETYETALRRDPSLADCHYNLALLCQDLRKPKEAIRHMAEYRRLTAGRSD